MSWQHLYEHLALQPKTCSKQTGSEQNGVPGWISAAKQVRTTYNLWLLKMMSVDEFVFHRFYPVAAEPYSLMKLSSEVSKHMMD